MTKLEVIGAAIACLVFGSHAAYAGSAENGHKVFEQKGCWQCHGHEGQGGSAGLRLANTKLTEDALIAFVHNTNGTMPPFSARLVSDAELSDVWAFLQSRRPPADPKTIPLLQR